MAGVIRAKDDLANGAIQVRLLRRPCEQVDPPSRLVIGLEGGFASAPTAHFEDQVEAPSPQPHDMGSRRYTLGVRATLAGDPNEPFGRGHYSLNRLGFPLIIIVSGKRNGLLVVRWRTMAISGRHRH